MDEAAIRDRYLDLFAIPARSPDIVQALQQLRDQAQDAGLDIWVHLIDARLLGAARRFPEALHVVEGVLQTVAGDPHALFLEAGLLAHSPDRRPESLAIIDRLAGALSTNTDLPSLRLIAMALVNKAVTLGKLDRPQEALDACNELTRRFADAAELALREQVAKALVNKGVTLGKLDRPQEALDAYNGVIRRFGDAPESALREPVAMALVNKGVRLGKLDRPQEELDAYNDLIRRFADAPELALREQVAMALVNKALTLGKLDRAQEGLDAYNDLIRRFADAPELALREPVASALFNKGVTLGELDRPQEELDAYNDLIRRFADAPELALREQVAKALVNKGVTLGKLDRPQEELDTYNDLMRRFADAPELAVREPVASALFNKGVTLGKLDRLQEELDAYNDVIRRFADASELALREQVAKALVNKGVTLGKLDRPQEELDAYNDLIRRFADAPELALRNQVAMALVNKGVTLGKLDTPQEALGAYNDLIGRFADAPELTLREQVARARVGRAISNASQGQVADALADLTTVIEDATASRRLQEHALLVRSSLESDRARQALQAVGELAVEIDARTRDAFKKELEEGSRRKDYFFEPKSQFCADQSFLLVLREWNSFTPAIPDDGEPARGGGYFIKHGKTGIVIDPGFDFLEIFHEAGGRLCDIDHIVVTHAHPDHTADLEAILTLLHEFNEKYDKKSERQRTVSLYLSQGASRKLAGIVPLRACSYIKEVVTLNRGLSSNPQRVHLCDDVVLTVLPAYHDDILTADCSVGLGLEFRFDGWDRHVLFTGDTAVVPRNGNGNEPSIFQVYPEPFNKPETVDLLVAHIGSIAPFELDEPLGTLSAEGRFFVRPAKFYETHLGLRGVFLAFQVLQPKAGVVSEFGEEMRTIWIKAVSAIDDKLKSVLPRGERIPIFAGDPVIIYSIRDAEFLCHEDLAYHDPADLRIVSLYQTGPGDRTGRMRPYLFVTEGTDDTADVQDHVEAFHKAMRERSLDHFTKPSK